MKHRRILEKDAPGDSGQSASPLRRIWLLTNAPSPYQAELLTAIAEREDLELDVRFMMAGSPAGRAAASRFSFRVMRSLTPRFLREELLFHPRAIWECAVSRHDCFVLSGLYTSVTFLVCAGVLTVRRVPWMVWFERPRPDRHEESHWSPRLLMSRPVRSLRRAVQKVILTSCDRVLCIGDIARDAYSRLGVPDRCLDVLPYCCSLERYSDVSDGAVRQIQDRFHLADKTVYLFSGQMIERKGVDTALSAFARIAENRADVAFLLLGDGPLRETLQRSVPEVLRSQVHFPGHVPQEQLPACFAAADVFVFPSRHDGWGVVMNEACAAGLPIIATHQTGAAHDLVEDGRSGFLFERDDVEGFAGAMQHFLDHPGDCALFGKRSRELVEQYSPRAGAERFHLAVEHTLNP